jgi:hypothetical protein
MSCKRNFFHFILKFTFCLRREIQVSHQATKRHLNMFFKARKVFFLFSYLFIIWIIKVLWSLKLLKPKPRTDQRAEWSDCLSALLDRHNKMFVFICNLQVPTQEERKIFYFI